MNANEIKVTSIHQPYFKFHNKIAITILQYIFLVYMLLLSGLNLITGNENISTYSVIGSPVVMNCPMDKIDDNPSWSRKGDILAFGMNIRNDTQLQYQRLRLVGQEQNKYNLMILNVTQTDEDEYCCVSINQNKSVQYCTRVKIIGIYKILLS